MRKTGITGSWSQDPGMVSKGKQHNKINKERKLSDHSKYKWDIY